MVSSHSLSSSILDLDFEHWLPKLWTLDIKSSCRNDCLLPYIQELPSSRNFENLTCLSNTPFDSSHAA